MTFDSTGVSSATSVAGDTPLSELLPELEAIAISKAFGGISVLKDIDFSVFAGEVHGLLGENGAGKSTLLKILQGVHQPDSGQIRVRGRQVSFANVKESRGHGVAMIFQEFSLIPDLTVGQNVFLNREKRNRLGLIDDAESNRRAAQVFEELEVDLDPTVVLSSLSTAQRQLVEIAKAVSLDPRVLIMDEPTASLAEGEVALLFELVARLQKRGIGIVYVSHRMKEIFDVCDRVTVLRDGQHVATKRVEDTDLEEIISLILGRGARALSERPDRSASISEAERLVVRNLSVGPLRDVSFSVRSGEILGIAGLMGSGRTELLQALFGIVRPTSGTIEVDGVAAKVGDPRSAIDGGQAMVPEDRRRQGLVMHSSIHDNLALPIWNRLASWGLLQRSKSRKLAGDIVTQLGVKATTIDQDVQLLSGGNQQKVVLGKWLATNPKILLLDEPTAGVDIGSKTEIVDIVLKAADSGMSVVVASSELSELLALSDRVLILRNGRAELELQRNEIDDDEHLQRLIHVGAPSTDSEQE